MDNYALILIQLDPNKNSIILIFSFPFFRFKLFQLSPFRFSFVFIRKFSGSMNLKRVLLVKNKSKYNIIAHEHACSHTEHVFN